jgi:transcriptional regulator with XRE-family HTH domain
MVNDKIGLGAWFKQVRIDRGFSLRQTASGFSAAALSRFERGQTDISADNMQKLMANLGLSTIDVGSFELQGDYAFPTAIQGAVIAQDCEAARKLRDRYMNAHTDEDNNLLLPITKAVFDMSMLPSDAGYHMDFALENRLLKMLSYPNMWGMFETDLAVCTYRFASNDFLHAVWGYYQELSEPGAPIDIVWILYAAILHADWKLVHDIRAFIGDFNEKKRYGMLNQNIVPMLHFLVDLSYWCDERDDSTYAKVQETLTMLHRLEYHKLVDYFDNLVHCVEQSCSGWNNRELEVPKVNLVSLANKPFNVACRLVREQRGLTMTQAALFWNKSTQSRLEAGTTQLGVSDAMLYSEMMLNNRANLQQTTDSQPLLDLVYFFNAVNAGTVEDSSETNKYQLGEKITTNVALVTSPWQEKVEWAVDLLVNVGKHRFSQKDHMMVEQFLTQKICYFQDTFLMQSVINQYSENLNLEVITNNMQQMFVNSSATVIECSTALFAALTSGGSADLAIKLLQSSEEHMRILVATEGPHTAIILDKFVALAKMKLIPDAVHQFVATEEAVRQLFSTINMADVFIQQVREVAPDVVQQSGIG